MRLRSVRTLLLILILGNLIIWHRLWREFTIQESPQFIRLNDAAVGNYLPEKFHEKFARLVTVIIRQFESFDNDVAASVKSILNYFPNTHILIVCNEAPYPPLGLDFRNETLRNVKLINLRASLNISFEDRNPLYYIRTKFVLFLPDSTRLATKQTIQEAIAQSSRYGIIAIPVGKNTLNCYKVGLQVKEWSLQLTNSVGNECDSVSGKHATMITSKILRALSDPFLLPFPDALYIQTAAIGLKVYIMKQQKFHEGQPVHRSQQSQWKLQELNKVREREMFEKFGIKKVTRSSNDIDWYGCTRETRQCFGTVVNGIPSYIYENRLTPPCCLAGLRKVAYHVFDKLEEVGIRYWLEGTSLLGAMRNGDILPWDHEIEVGIYRDDLNRSEWIVKARYKSVVDTHGFVWEKATKGDFFRIQYSKVNDLHVNLLPFYAKNGTMTKDSWFLRNLDFPEQFLHPMSSIEFAGRQVPSPNNIRDFLEIKYYKGVIENPQIPGIQIPLD